jgi:hypothetical protein
MQGDKKRMKRFSGADSLLSSFSLMLGLSELKDNLKTLVSKA